ncbi:aminotransferase V [Spirochaetia bacterium]|nr:aminotransferase V [Spirochaetia bacterium]
MRYFFDWAGTAKPDGSVYSIPQTAPFGNPSSKHAEGRLAAAALEDARARCARSLGVSGETLYCTSGGTESNAIVLFSQLEKKTPSAGIITTLAEHPSVTENCKKLQKLGIPVHNVPLDAAGTADCNAMPESGGLVSIMTVNNETGAVSDIPGLCERVKAPSGKRAHFHSDMVQALGKIPVGTALSCLDSASFSAHKIGGPRGIGLLYLKKPLAALISGGGQEKGIRSGTENVAGALAFAKVLEARTGDLENQKAAAQERILYLIAQLRAMPRAAIIPGCRLGCPDKFSPYILQCSFDGIPGEVMARLLDDAGFALSTGSACSKSHKNRPVLEAMGVDKKKSMQAIRISQGWSTTGEEIEALIAAIKAILEKH